MVFFFFMKSMPDVFVFNVPNVTFHWCQQRHVDIKRCRYIYIKLTKTRVLVVYPLWMYINRYDRLAAQFCLRVNRLNLCYAWYSHVWGRISGQFRPFEFRIYTATVWDYTPPLPVLFEYISLSIFYLYIYVYCTYVYAIFSYWHVFFCRTDKGNPKV